MKQRGVSRSLIRKGVHPVLNLRFFGNQRDKTVGLTSLPFSSYRFYIFQEWVLVFIFKKLFAVRICAVGHFAGDGKVSKINRVHFEKGQTHFQTKLLPIETITSYVHFQRKEGSSISLMNIYFLRCKRW
jgi:hypothetical protein